MFSNGGVMSYGRRLRADGLVVALGCALVSTLAVTPPAALASPTAHWNPGIEAPLPLDAVARVANVNAVSCPSAGNCEAVGFYSTTPNDEAMVLRETAGSWPQHATTVTLPNNADATNQNAPLDSVSCASVGNCSAVGSYYASSNQQGLLVTEKSGVWHQGVEATLPTPAHTGVGVLNLTSVSCASPGNCGAVGHYVDGSGNRVGLLLSQIAGTWHNGAAVSPPVNISGTPSYVYVNSVSCPTAGSCSAVGYYSGPSGSTQALLVSETSGKWQKGVEAVLPAHAITGINQDAELNSVSCVSAGNCTAVGFYVNGSGNYQSLLLSETSGKWGKGVTVSLPHGAATSSQSVYLGAVSCRSAGNCSAAGSYTDSSISTQGLLVNEVSGTWQPGIKASLPSDANTTASSQDVTLDSVACVSPGNCTAVGDYIDTSDAQQALMLSENSGKWQRGIEATLPGNHATNPSAALKDVSEHGGPSVSCASTGSCTAVGTYIQTTGSDNDGLLLSTSPARPTLSVNAPVSGKVGHLIAPSALAAKLASGAAPVGTIAFKVFGPQTSPPTSCGSGGRRLGSATVSGNGTYHPSAGFSPARAGDYWWYAAYGGDASDLPAASKCGASMAKTVVK